VFPRFINSRRVASCIGLVVVIAAAAWGATRLEAYVVAQDTYQSAPSITLVDVPEGLEESLLRLIRAVTDRAWVDPQLCRDVAEVLSLSPWVEEVRAVRRGPEGHLRVTCRYRTPAAMVQIGSEFYIVGADRVCLPGVYRYHPSLVVVQGVRGLAPDPGDVWAGDDLKAAIDLIQLLHREPFFEQITGVLVENYDGYLDRSKPHILLATAPGDGRIAWGSAPGKEIEESTVDQKLALLRENFRRWGRIDAGRRYIDVSVYPDRFTTR